MKYWLINTEDEQYWIEVTDVNIAMRQIIKDADDIIRISCTEDCLAEGVIDVENIEGETIEISVEEFEVKWNTEIKAYHNHWELQKIKYPIGQNVEGKIEYFYPQGIIMQIGEAKGVYQNRETHDSNEYSNYPMSTIKGKVKGYDDKNMWLIIS